VPRRIAGLRARLVGADLTVHVAHHEPGTAARAAARRRAHRPRKQTVLEQLQVARPRPDARRLLFEVLDTAVTVRQQEIQPVRLAQRHKQRRVKIPARVRDGERLYRQAVGATL